MTYHRDRTEGAGAISAFLPAHRSAPAPRIRARRPGRWHMHGALGLIRVDDEGGGGGGGGSGPTRPISATAPMVMPVMSYGTRTPTAPPSGLLTAPPSPLSPSRLSTSGATGIRTAPPVLTIKYPVQIGSGIGQPAPVIVATPPKPAGGGVRPAAAEPVMPTVDMLELEDQKMAVSPSGPIKVSRLPLVLAAGAIGLAYYLFRGKGRH